MPRSAPAADPPQLAVGNLQRARSPLDRDPHTGRFPTVLRRADLIDPPEVIRARIAYYARPRWRRLLDPRRTP